MMLPHSKSFAPGRIRPLALLAAAVLAVMIGCERNDSTPSSPPNSSTGAAFGYHPGHDVEGPGQYTNANPSGAQVAGVPSGMGFNTGDAAQSGGMGTGLMGFHDVGAAGTSGAITDMRTPNNPINMHGPFLSPK